MFLPPKRARRYRDDEGVTSEYYAEHYLSRGDRVRAPAITRVPRISI
jgi:hypothetical protein